LGVEKLNLAAQNAKNRRNIESYTTEQRILPQAPIIFRVCEPNAFLSRRYR
jgi:hypothetical protein